jgi:hypothetical protein
VQAEKAADLLAAGTIDAGQLTRVDAGQLTRVTEKLTAEPAAQPPDTGQPLAGGQYPGRLR